MPFSLFVWPVLCEFIYMLSSIISSYFCFGHQLHLQCIRSDFAHNRHWILLGNNPVGAFLTRKHFAYIRPFFSLIFLLQLAEAILTEPNDDVISIRLADARTPRLDEDEDSERQFLVGNDDAHGNEGLRSRSTSLDREQAEPHTSMPHSDLSIMMNGHEDADVEESTGMKNSSRGLSGKAGIILVRCFLASR